MKSSPARTMFQIWLLLAACLLNLSVANAATRTWTGAGGNVFWQTAGNWGGTAPVAGDDLVFPVTAFNASTNSYPVGTLFNSITITATNHVFSGQGITLGSGGLTYNSPSMITFWSIPITFGAAQTFSVDQGKFQIGSATINFNGFNLVVTGTGTTQLGANGILTGIGNVTMNGSGYLQFNGPASTYVGATTINAGIVFISSPTGAIPDTSDVTVAAGATLNLAGADETIGSLSGSGNVIADGTYFRVGGNNNSTTFSGIISGNAQLVTLGTGVLTLSGPNSYAGSTAISGLGGTIRVGAAGAIPDSSHVSTNFGGTFDLNGFNETIGSLGNSGGAAGFTTLGTGTLTTGVDNLHGAYPGVISGSGGITKIGTGDQFFSGNNTYTGPTLISNGVLAIQGSQPASNITVNGAGAAMWGSGIAGQTTVTAGSIRAGTAAGPGMLTVQGDFAMTPGSNFLARLNSNVAGTGYDQLTVAAGNVTLNNATLSLSLGFVPVAGSSFTLINNVGGKSVIGTFNGLPHGAALTVGGANFTISYTGGAGQDVVLTAAAAAVPGAVASIPTLGDAGMLLLCALIALSAYAETRKRHKGH